MKKIIIVGSSGAGKTTLANKLSVILNIPAFELDALYHQADWKITEEQIFISEVNKLTEYPSWIICGNYFTRLGRDYWSKADTIIWCDYPFHTVLRRLLSRTFVRGLKQQELWNGNKESLRKSLFTTDSVILWMLRSWQKQKTRYTAIFADHSDMPNINFIRLRNAKETEKFFKTLL